MEASRKGARAELPGLECCQMRLWFAHGGAVTLREQLVTQIVLAIVSNDLRPGQRLPSTREMARRFHLHPNTVSAGYRELERARWVESRRGSGVYVCENKPESAGSAITALDRMVGELLHGARTLGIPLTIVRARLRHWLEVQPPDHFLLLEPDEELRRILIAEMSQAVSLPVKGCAPQGAEIAREFEGAIPVALAGKEKLARKVLPAGAELLVLRIRSVPTSLAGWLPAPSEILIGVASRWPRFLKLARTMLVAAGFSPDMLLFRDARRANWQRGLKEVKAVVCDSSTAVDLLKPLRAIAFTMISEASLEELRHYEEFACSPLEIPT
jgi:DNA-binding transcriptional regulator YhcF (GntR family)